MENFRADLHCHSTCSDGTLSPVDIISLAKDVGLSAISITDHDTIEAYSMAYAKSLELGIELLPGVELSAVYEGTSVHVLGYGFEATNSLMASFCAKHAERRKLRNRIILDLLAKNGLEISESDIIASHHSIGRPHIAMALIKKGYVKNFQEAFQKYLGDDKPCFAPSIAVSVEETIDIIHEAKGIAVLAHPHFLPEKGMVNRLLEMPFDGLECYYGSFHADHQKRWLDLAHKRNLLITGGSDFHGDIKPLQKLGCSWVDQETFQLIKDRSSSLNRK